MRLFLFCFKPSFFAKSFRQHLPTHLFAAEMFCQNVYGSKNTILSNFLLYFRARFKCEPERWRKCKNRKVHVPQIPDLEEQAVDSEDEPNNNQVG
jgi:hypothetical protein